MANIIILNFLLMIAVVVNGDKPKTYPTRDVDSNKRVLPKLKRLSLTATPTNLNLPVDQLSELQCHTYIRQGLHYTRCYGPSSYQSQWSSSSFDAPLPSSSSYQTQWGSSFDAPVPPPSSYQTQWGSSYDAPLPSSSSYQTQWGSSFDAPVPPPSSYQTQWGSSYDAPLPSSSSYQTQWGSSFDAPVPPPSSYQTQWGSSYDAPLPSSSSYQTQWGSSFDAPVPPPSSYQTQWGSSYDAPLPSSSSYQTQWGSSFDAPVPPTSSYKTQWGSSYDAPLPSSSTYQSQWGSSYDTPLPSYNSQYSQDYSPQQPSYGPQQPSYSPQRPSCNPQQPSYISQQSSYYLQQPSYSPEYPGSQFCGTSEISSSDYVPEYPIPSSTSYGIFQPLNDPYDMSQSSKNPSGKFQPTNDPNGIFQLSNDNYGISQQSNDLNAIFTPTKDQLQPHTYDYHDPKYPLDVFGADYVDVGFDSALKNSVSSNQISSNRAVKSSYPRYKSRTVKPLALLVALERTKNDEPVDATRARKFNIDDWIEHDELDKIDYRRYADIIKVVREVMIDGLVMDSVKHNHNYLTLLYAVHYLIYDAMCVDLFSHNNIWPPSKGAQRYYEIIGQVFEDIKDNGTVIETMWEAIFVDPLHGTEELLNLITVVNNTIPVCETEPELCNEYIRQIIRSSPDRANLISQGKILRSAAAVAELYYFHYHEMFVNAASEKDGIRKYFIDAKDELEDLARKVKQYKHDVGNTDCSRHSLKVSS